MHQWLHNALFERHSIYSHSRQISSTVILCARISTLPPLAAVAAVDPSFMSCLPRTREQSRAGQEPRTASETVGCISITVAASWKMSFRSQCGLGLSYYIPNSHNPLVLGRDLPLRLSLPTGAMPKRSLNSIRTLATQPSPPNTATGPDLTSLFHFSFLICHF